MKRILFVRDNIRVGGATSSLIAVYDYLKDKADIDFFVASYEGEDVEFKDKILERNFILDAYLGDFNTHRFATKTVMVVLKLIRHLPAKGRAIFEDFLFKNAAHRIEKKIKYDVVVGFMEGTSTKLASFFNCDNRIAWVHCDYDRYLPRNKSEEALYSQFKHIVAVSDYTSEVFRKRYPHLSDRVTTIHNIINFNKILLKAKEAILDSRYDIKSFSIISVGRIDKVKRFSEIPSIASKLKNKGVFFKWYVLGPIREEDEFDKLMRNIASYSVGDCVIYLGEKTNPYPYFASASLYVCLSSSEACPMVFNEAKVFNLPIVTTDFPSASEFVRQNEDGIIVPMKDIADGISKMIADNGYYNRMKSGSLDIDNSSARIYDKINNLFLLK